jgi:hypothetical protein
MTIARDICKKLSQKVTSGQITEENIYTTNAFLWEIIGLFVIMFEKQSVHFEQLRQEMDF